MRKLVWREMFERRSQLATSFLAVLLGIAVVVSIKNITFYSQKAVARELDALGANILVLPKSVTLQDYYSADMHDEVIPEEYVMRLTMSDVQGVDNLSPKLCARVNLQGKDFALTGILPKNEFQAKAAWAVGAGAVERGCADASLYKRFHAAGLQQIGKFPHLAVYDDSQSVMAQFYQSRILSALTLDERTEWQTAVAQAEAKGAFVLSVPHHCAIGTKS